MGHAWITVTAHIYTNLYDSDRAPVADALGTLTDRSDTQHRVASRPPGAHQELQVTFDRELNRRMNAGQHAFSSVARPGDRTNDLPL